MNNRANATSFKPGHAVVGGFRPGNAWTRKHGLAATPVYGAWLKATRKFGEFVPLDIWLIVWSGPCFGCGRDPALGVDHITSWKRGGRNIVENLQPACMPCNRSKGAR